MTQSSWSQSHLMLCPPFQQFPSDKPVPKFDYLPEGPWRKANLPLIREEVAADYLKKKGGYTKNFRTGVRLCQCGHLMMLR